MPTEREPGPLADLGVVVTRDEDGEGRLTAALEERGARVIHWPTIEAAPPEDPTPLRAALSDLEAYDWLVLTSRRAAEAVAEYGPRAALAAAAARVAAVGRGTGEAAAAAGLTVGLVPGEQTGEALVEALRRAGVGPGVRVLFPASSIARPTVPDGLRALGATVDRVTAYRIVPAALDREACREVVERGGVGAVTVTSPSSVRSLRSALGESLFRAVAGTAVFAAIGPVTGAAARETGARSVIESRDHSLDGLAERLVEWRRDLAHRGAQ